MSPQINPHTLYFTLEYRSFLQSLNNFILFSPAAYKSPVRESDVKRIFPVTCLDKFETKHPFTIRKLLYTLLYDDWSGTRIYLNNHK